MWRSLEGDHRHCKFELAAIALLAAAGAVSHDELAELNLAVESLERAGLDERAKVLEGLAVKLRAMSQPSTQGDLDSDLETLMNAEGLAMQAGPRPQLQEGVLALLREAIKCG